MSATEHTLLQQTEAARELLAVMRDYGADDDAELVADAIEGETDLLEAIAAALAEIDEAEVLILGGKEKVDQFQRRIDAEKARVERLRAAIERAMIATDQPSIRLATATLSTSKRKPQPVIDNEAE